MSTNERIAVCPGTFDPITYGHLDLIHRGLKIFDRIVIAVATQHEKQPLFTVSERMDMISKALDGVERITISSFDGLVVDYAAEVGACALIRGVRMLSDFEYEFQMALTNRKLNKDIETMFLMPNESYAYLTSRLIKEIASKGADISTYVPECVNASIKQKLLA